MQTSDTILDVVLLFIFIAVIKYIDFNPILEMIALSVGIIYGIVKIIHEIMRMYYLKKDKEK
ncbi:MAG: hypothetical protein IIA88_10570 [Bacteroidetes bacterium]|nr:hypothetical protein [Bacteroidota bacterium]